MSFCKVTIMSLQCYRVMVVALNTFYNKAHHFTDVYTMVQLFSILGPHMEQAMVKQDDLEMRSTKTSLPLLQLMM